MSDFLTFSSASDTASIIVNAVNDAPSFAPPNGAGKMLYPVGSGVDYGGIDRQADGKIVVAGTSYGASDSVGVMRLNADGSLDTSFSDDGKAFVGVVGLAATGLAHGL